MTVARVNLLPREWGREEHRQAVQRAGRIALPALAAAALAVLGGLYGQTVLAERDAARLAAEQERLQPVIQLAEAVERLEREVAARQRVAAARAGRPVEPLLAGVAALVPPGVRLERLALEEGDVLVMTGRAPRLATVAQLLGELYRSGAFADVEVSFEGPFGPAGAADRVPFQIRARWTGGRPR